MTVPYEFMMTVHYFLHTNNYKEILYLTNHGQTGYP